MSAPFFSFALFREIQIDVRFLERLSQINQDLPASLLPVGKMK